MKLRDRDVAAFYQQLVETAGWFGRMTISCFEAGELGDGSLKDAGFPSPKEFLDGQPTTRDVLRFYRATALRVVAICDKGLEAEPCSNTPQ